MELLIPTLTALAAQLPVVMVWIIGLVLALVFWKRNPRVSLLTLIAIMGFIINMLVGTYLSIWLPTMRDQGWSINQIGTALGLIGFIRSFVGAILWGLVLVAIFGWREKAVSGVSEDAHTP